MKLKGVIMLTVKPHGSRRWWYNNDQHTLESEKHFVNGERDGLWKKWYGNEQHTLKQEDHYFNNERYIHWLEFDPNGNITFDGEYINGVKIQ